MNKHFLILLAAMSLVSAAAPKASADPAEAPAVRLTFEMSDGSRLIGTTSIDKLKITTQYADLEIKLPLLRTIEFSGTNHAAQVTLKNGDLLKGQLAATEIAVKATFGQVVVPMAQVRKIRVTGPAAALPEGLVLHYTFEENEGQKVADKSSSGNDGTIQNATRTGDARPGGAVNFSGDRQRIVIKNSASLQLQDFSILAWVKLGGQNNRVTLTGPSGGGMLFGYGQGGYSMGFDGRGHLSLTKVGIDNVSVNYGISDNAFHHVGVTKKGNKVVFYVDGVAHPGPDYNTNFEFGTDLAVAARGDDLDSWFLGAIGELEVFNRALSEDEAKGIYDSQKTDEDVENAAKPQPPVRMQPPMMLWQD